MPDDVHAALYFTLVKIAGLDGAPAKRQLRHFSEITRERAFDWTYAKLLRGPAQGWASLSADQAVYNWLYRVIYNRALELLRRDQQLSSMGHDLRDALYTAAVDPLLSARAALQQTWVKIVLPCFSGYRGRGHFAVWLEALDRRRRLVLGEADRQSLWAEAQAQGERGDALSFWKQQSKSLSRGLELLQRHRAALESAGQGERAEALRDCIRSLQLRRRSQQKTRLNSSPCL